MGAFSYLTIAGYPTYDNKNEYYNDVSNLIFQPEDFITEYRPYKEKNRLYWGDAYDNEDSNFEFKGFRQTVGVCLKRLEIYGYSLLTAQKEWSAVRANVLNQYYLPDYDLQLKKISFAAYYRELRNVISNKIINYEQARDSLQNILIS
ncbi:HEPN/Toprim-associated domain-containing protein, partial [Pedobacter sp.]|uniref:HEPN/Toprim-associated domain-containing protein n=1 Tax=Pedobacter sp. TaxID=1411316 RepID=UPI003D7F19FC